MSAASDAATLRLEGVAKSFTLHLQGGLRLPVLDGLDLAVSSGECVILQGPSGAGKSSVLKLAWGNYAADAGRILLRHLGQVVDLATADARAVQAARRHSMGYVSQFLRAVPRVPALDVVAEPLLLLGVEPALARARAAALLERLNIPGRLMTLPPATFSGGEQQRVNIARTLIHPWPLLLLDEPTASLDTANRAAVVALVQEAKAAGAAVLGVLHNADAADALADRRHLLLPVAPSDDRPRRPGPAGVAAHMLSQRSIDV